MDFAMADILFSYAHEDRNRATVLVDILKRYGWSTWWDNDMNYVANTPFRRRIEGELKSSGSVIVLWTPDSIASAWVRAEARFGLAYRKLIQLTYGINPSDLPAPFGEFLFIDLANWGDQSDHPVLDGLIRSLAILCGPPPTPPSGNYYGSARTGVAGDMWLPRSGQSSHDFEHELPHDMFGRDFERYVPMLLQSARDDTPAFAGDATVVVDKLQDILRTFLAVANKDRPLRLPPRISKPGIFGDPTGGLDASRFKRGPGSGKLPGKGE